MGRGAAAAKAADDWAEGRHAIIKMAVRGGPARGHSAQAATGERLGESRLRAPG